MSEHCPRENIDETEVPIKEQIDTTTEHFDALFARSQSRSYSSTTPSNIPVANAKSNNLYAKSQPQLITRRTSSPSRSSPDNRQHQIFLLQSTTRSASTGVTSATPAPVSGRASSGEPLARSCSYKRPQSIKKYRRKEKEQKRQGEEAKEYSSTSSRKSTQTTQNNNISRTGISVDSLSRRKSSRVSVTDLMANDDEQWSSPRTQRSTRLGSLPLDQLQIPIDPPVDEEVYRVRQFNTTSKGFVNRGDSFKRSFKRSGSNSRRSSFRKIDPTAQEQMSNNNDEDVRTSVHSLTPSTTLTAGPNLNNILDNHFVSLANETNPLMFDIHPDAAVEHEDEEAVVERVETEDGRVENIRIYQVYLLGMSGTGKCSLMRQFKTTEYRGIYDYSSSLDDDPDNTVSIMLDGIESRLHIINIDVDLVKCSIVGDAYVVVYSITDRTSFQTAVQLIKNIREREITVKRHVPIILVGNKTDLVRKRAVTKEAARHAAFRHDCKFVETSAAINDKVDDLLAGTLKQIRLCEQERRRLTLTDDLCDKNDFDTQQTLAMRKGSTVVDSKSKNVFSKFLNVFRKKPSKLSSDVENLNTGSRPDI